MALRGITSIKWTPPRSRFGEETFAATKLNRSVNKRVQLQIVGIKQKIISLSLYKLETNVGSYMMMGGASEIC